MNEPPLIEAVSIPPSRRWPRRLLLGVIWLGTLVVLFYIEENWRGAHALKMQNREAGPAVARLDPTHWIPPAIPDSENLAATPFFEELFPQSGNHARDRALNKNSPPDFARNFAPDDFRRRRPGSCWANGRISEVINPKEALEYLEEFRPVFNELQNASHRPNSRFNLQYDLDNPWGILLPHLEVLRHRLCPMLALRASAELALRQSDLAAQDIQLGFQLADSLRTEPIFISQLVRVSFLEVLLEPVWEGLSAHRWNESQLAALQDRMRSFDLISSLHFALEAERAWGNRTIDFARSGRIPLESLFGTSDLSDSLPFQVLRLGPSGWFDLEKVNYNRLFQEAVFPGIDPSNRQIDPKVSEMGQQQLERELASARVSVLRHNLFARLLLPSVRSATARFAFFQTTLNEAIVACALERHRLATGRYPNALDELDPRLLKPEPLDPISGKRLFYRVEKGGGITLYGVGWNGLDDGGTVEPKAARRLLDKQSDWVWHYQGE